MAFLLIRLKKYLIPDENSCSKVISILTTVNILHESSSAPRQHKSVTEIFRIQTCCNHILSAAEGFRGQEATCADPGFFVSFIKSSAYFTVYRGGPTVLLLRKLYLCFTKDPEGVHYLPGGVKLFPGGVQILISLQTHIRTCYFPGGVSGPPIPLWIRTWAMSL